MIAIGDAILDARGAIVLDWGKVLKDGGQSQQTTAKYYAKYEAPLILLKTWAKKSRSEQ